VLIRRRLRLAVQRSNFVRKVGFLTDSIAGYPFSSEISISCHSECNEESVNSLNLQIPPFGRNDSLASLLCKMDNQRLYRLALLKAFD